MSPRKIPKILTRIPNFLLLASLIVTFLAPLTGIVVHKLASALFLLLCLVHTLLCRRGITVKRLAMLAVVGLAFASGVLSLIFDRIPLVLALHKVISVGSVAFLAVHIFIFRKRLR